MRTAGEGAGGCRRGKKQRDTEGGMSSASHLECQTLAVHLGIFQRQPKIIRLYLYTAFYIVFISPFILGFYPPTTLLSSLYLSIIPALLHISPHSFFVTCLHILAARWDLVWAVGLWGGGQNAKDQGKERKKERKVERKKRVLTQRKRHKHFLIRWVGEEGQKTGAGSVCMWVCVCGQAAFRSYSK